MSKSNMLNIGCGTSIHPDWINLDVAPVNPTVLQLDINHGLPFSADTVDVCYSSHMLEHLSQEGAHNFVAECMRVLKSGGVIRLVVPDLEGIAREYLRALDAVATGDKTRESDYDWIMLELYDQVVRSRPGGEMAKYLKNIDVSQRAFIKSRIGAEADNLWNNKAAPVSLPMKVRLVNHASAFRMRFVCRVISLLAGKAALNSFLVGLFRDRGEIHQWMYDRFSLQRLLERAGFVDVKICLATESRIRRYEQYSLDTLNGFARKPDSIYIEATKP
jgi:predicted SAM-dependent methyltransferase